MPTKKNSSLVPSPKPSAAAADIIRRSVRERSRALVAPPAKAAVKTSTEFRIRKLMTSVQVEEALEVSESWLKRSDIPFIKLGRLRRYDAAVVNEYLAARDSAA